MIFALFIAAITIYLTGEYHPEITPFFDTYITPILFKLDFIILLVVLVILIEAYIFSQSIQSLLGKNIIIIVRIITFTLAFYIFIDVIYTETDTYLFVSLLAIKDRMSIASYVNSIINFVHNNIPRIALTVAMWVLFYGNLDKRDDESQIDEIMSNSLVSKDV